MWLWDYVVAVLGGWWGLAAALLGANEIFEKLFGVSWGWLREVRWRVVTVLLLAAPAFVYRELSRQVQDLTQQRQQQQQSPVVAENPDHAGLVDKVDKATERIRALEKERDEQAAARRDAERQVRELEGKLAASAEQTVACDRLVAMSAVGRELVGKLFKTRAAPETRKEVDQWYANVCKAMTGPQCEAFRSAPRKADVWMGYPADDGGYSQTLRGRSEYLSAQLTRLCS